MSEERTATPGATPTRGASSPRRSWALRAVQIAVTIAAFAWVLARADLERLGAAFAAIPLWSFAVAIALTFANLGIGTVRWQVLMRAYGASRVPPLGRLYVVYWIGFFYNIWLPGGVGGDVVRGVATREAFGAEGTTGAISVVFVERVLGLVGLLSIVGLSSLLRPIEGLGPVGLWSAIGIAASAGAVIAIALGRSLAPRLPGPLKRIAEKLPSIVRPGPFAIALLLSLGTQTMVALTGHMYIGALHPEVPLSTSMVMIPVAMATAYLPITAGGAGARELVYAELYARVGVPAEDAVAASLLLAATYYASTMFAGIVPVPRAAPAEAH